MSETKTTAYADSEALVQSLLAGNGIDHPVDTPTLIETHISWVILAGDYVYKLKKPVDLGFLDFTTPVRRRFFCQEELRINRRTAPALYLDVLPVSGSPDAPRVGDDAEPFDYLVKMARFDQQGILSRLAEEQQLDGGIVSTLARSIATFHDSIAGQAESGHGSPESIHREMTRVTERLGSLVESREERALLGEISDWIRATEDRLKPVFEARIHGGYIRECHGDLHLGNIVYQDGECTLFDALEFSADLRWTDTACDLAFAVMDIETHELHDLAHQLLNEYLDYTGDYGSLQVLPYYLVYRALVRAMVSRVRAGQDVSDEEAGRQRQACHEYLQMAHRYTGRKIRALVLMCGLSGTGKSTVAKQLAAQLSAIHIRSDVVRKRLFGLDPLGSSHTAAIDIYTRQATHRTFAHLAELLQVVLDSGYGCIVDGTFIDRSLRKTMLATAASLDVPACIVHCDAPPDVVRQRLAKRTGDVSEAGIREYESQRAAFEDFDGEEMPRVIRVDTAAAFHVQTSTRQLLSLLESQGRP